MPQWMPLRLFRSMQPTARLKSQQQRRKTFYQGIILTSSTVRGSNTKLESICVPALWCGCLVGFRVDLGLSRLSYVEQLRPGELTVADDGYNDGNYFMFPRAYPDYAHELKAIAQRHETINNLFKRWNVLRTPFRHELEKHRLCFYAIAHIVQLMIMSGEPFYHIEIDEDIF